MANSCKYRVRVLHRNGHVIIHENLSRDAANEQFIYYVRACLELGVNIRCVNIFLGKKCINLFNYHYNYGF